MNKLDEGKEALLGPQEVDTPVPYVSKDNRVKAIIFMNLFTLSATI